ncbi:hypothetical protein NMY22_g19016 [Coprinellus aureogranulatus]|nr:hypothetical protein NMY22_g19016 [Coprinellus aureogranulatus]
MSKVTVEDQSGRIQYSDGWVENGVCVACDTSVDKIIQVASGGTWMQTWWADNTRVVTATMEFEGTGVDAYFLFFWRSQDPNSTGEGNLFFFVDDKLEMQKPVVASDYQFTADIAPRTLVFSKSGYSAAKHTLRIQWTNNGPRPRVAVGLDRIDYTPCATDPQPTTPNASSPPSSSSSSSSSSDDAESDTGKKQLFSSQDADGREVKMEVVPWLPMQREFMHLRMTNREPLGTRFSSVLLMYSKFTMDGSLPRSISSLESDWLWMGFTKRSGTLQLARASHSPPHSDLFPSSKNLRLLFRGFRAIINIVMTSQFSKRNSADLSSQHVFRHTHVRWHPSTLSVSLRTVEVAIKRDLGRLYQLKRYSNANHTQTTSQHPSSTLFLATFALPPAEHRGGNARKGPQRLAVPNTAPISGSKHACAQARAAQHPVTLSMIETLLTYASPLLQYDIVVRTLFQVLRWVYWPLNDLLKRVDNSPGLPVPNPTSPYWMHPPSPIAQRNAPGSKGKNIPEYADIVIIGSGITGTSFARTILDHGKGNDVHGKPLNVVMLEARDTCSGATGRNGGHITPVLYQDYVALKKEHGKDMAQKIVRFRLSHLEELLQVAEEEGLLDDSQCRRVEAFDVFHDKDLFSEAKAWFREYKEDLPEESRHYKIYETPEEIEVRYNCGSEMHQG